MKILIRGKRNEKWQVVQSMAYEAESELQRLLAEDPSLIAFNEIREGAGPLVAAIREFPLDIGSIDILAFSAFGDIAVIECKLASNDEIKRKVIGQVFEYGANLLGLSYEALDKKVNFKTNKSIADLVHDSIDDPDWDEETFRRNIINTLTDGSFILMIVVDEINEELGKILRFINYAGKPAFSLSALEMKRFQHGETEMLVPHVFGAIEKRKQEAGPSNRMKWDEASFFEDVQKKLKPPADELVKNLFEWSSKNADSVRFGSGWASGSYTFCLERDNKMASVFSVFTNGIITINYGYMKKIFSRDQIKEFSTQIASIPTMKGSDSPEQFYFNISIDSAFSTIEFLEKFKKEVLCLKKNVIKKS